MIIESTERKPFRIESFANCTLIKLFKNQHLKHHGSRAIISCKRFMSKYKKKIDVRSTEFFLHCIVPNYGVMVPSLKSIRQF